MSGETATTREGDERQEGEGEALTTQDGEGEGGLGLAWGASIYKRGGKVGW
jgi:hypothetical protein